MLNEIPLELISNKLSIILVGILIFNYLKHKKRIEVIQKLDGLKNENQLTTDDISYIIENKKETDYIIVISASPLFLIDSFVKKLGFTHVFGTIMETEERNGKKYYLPKVVGENCKNVEKVKVINRWAKEEEIKYKTMIQDNRAIA